MCARHLYVVVLCLLCLGGSGSAAWEDNAESPVGVNFWFWSDWSNVNWPLVDFFKSSRPFWAQPANGTNPWNLDQALDLDSNGYPTSLPSGVGAATLLMWGDGGYHPAGEYTVLYDGEGEITFWSNASVVTSEPGRIVIDVERRDSGFLLKIKTTTPGNHVRNIRVIAPGFESTYHDNPWHPLFLERLKEFRCLRFMDWMRANTSRVVDWADRVTPNHQTFSEGEGSGVPVEYLVDLCNRLDADGWFCLPAAGSDDYYQKTIAYIRDNLKPHLKAYFEYANEVWNGAISYGRSYTEDQGVALGLGTGWSACHRYWAMRMGQMFEMVEQAYGADTTRYVNVIATQVGNTGVLSGLIDYHIEYSSDGENHGDVVAGAPYFNPGGVTSGVDAVLDGLASAAADYATSTSLTWTAAKGAEYGMNMVCYEAGPDIYMIDETIREDVRFHSRMYDIYTTYLNSLRTAGNTLVMQYTFCNGSWGLMHYLDQDTSAAPAYLAALHYVRGNPRWWEESRVDVSAPSFPQHRPTVAEAPQFFMGWDNRIRLRATGTTPTLRVLTLDGRLVPFVSLPAGAWQAPAGVSASLLLGELCSNDRAVRRTPLMAH